jgi:biopolymer transport protein ExbB
MNVIFTTPTRLAAFVLAAVTLVGPLCQSKAQAQESTAGEPPITIVEKSDSTPPAANGGTIQVNDLWSITKAGGPLMIPIALCSFILLVFVFERSMSLRRGRIIPKPFVTRFLQQIDEGELNRQTALELCEESASPVAEVFASAVRKWGRPSVEIEQAVIDSGERITNGLRRYLRVINGVATVSPLLGLLGTVVGMIKSFNQMAVTDQPELLARGIGEALLTTAAGLSVAIPALIFYLFFVSRVDRLIIDIDAMGQQLVDAISAEELEGKGKKTKKKQATPLAA